MSGLVWRWYGLSCFYSQNNLEYFVKVLCRAVIDTFSRFLSSDIAVSEKGALQLLFDFRYMIKIVEGGLSGMDSTVKEILSLIKSKIDPIDLAVAEVNILSNVERQYLRTLVSLGSFLILNPKPIDLYVLVLIG